MATTARPTTRATSPPTARRPPPSISTSPPPIARGATARSALSPRAPVTLQNNAARRTSLKVAPPAGASHGDVRESREILAASLKHETEQKEQLLVNLQDKEQTIASLTSENDNLTSALSAAEVRLNELYADQSRAEEEMAARIEVSEKLRNQVRELEKEKRDVQRRYNEQTSTFEAERQAFYDNEQHLKSRIQSLSQTRKQSEPIVEHAPEATEAEDDDIPEQPAQQHQTPKQDLNDPETEPAEMTSLKLELSTLSTSYSSLQSTLVLLQTQLVDLKRVNHELQEENESYMILLREKTLSGQFDLMKQVGGGSSDSDDEGDDDPDVDDSVDMGSIRSAARSTLDPVDELPEDLEQELERSLQPRDADSPVSFHSRQGSRQRKRSQSNAAPRGESLADLPITGPGLDLAAELGRAENKDMLASNGLEDRSVLNGKGKRGKKSIDARKVSSDATHGPEAGVPVNDLDALRTEVKSLKDANKALSLYASKIIDRIISQEGFEHVLAADYEKQPPTPSTAHPASAGAISPKSPFPPAAAPSQTPRVRPQSVIVGRSTSHPAAALGEQDAWKLNTSPPAPAMAKSNSAGPNPKANRRSLSFDWKSFSIFNSEKKTDSPALRPLTLKPGSSPVTGRKLETEEDEDDRRERERLNATMKLMGIQPPAPASPALVPPVIDRGQASPSESPKPPLSTPSRFSFFRSRSTADNSETSSVNSTPATNGASGTGLGISGTSHLTEEALVQAEAESSLAALDAQERSLSQEIARGAAGGFTEIAPRGSGEDRRSRRSKRSGGGSGSGSTVWSAGMSQSGDDPA